MSYTWTSDVWIPCLSTWHNQTIWWDNFLNLPKISLALIYLELLNGWSWLKLYFCHSSNLVSYMDLASPQLFYWDRTKFLWDKVIFAWCIYFTMRNGEHFTIFFNLFTVRCQSWGFMNRSGLPRDPLQDIATDNTLKLRKANSWIPTNNKEDTWRNVYTLYKYTSFLKKHSRHSNQCHEKLNTPPRAIFHLAFPFCSLVDKIKQLSSEPSSEIYLKARGLVIVFPRHAGENSRLPQIPSF